MIAAIKIFPPIGVARLGNSENGYFIGPEKPGVTPIPADGFRDGSGAIKRQAARFHLFAFDENGKLVQELTADDVRSLEWTVHIANTKAAAPRFTFQSVADPGLRNANFGDRGQLKLDPGAGSVSGRNPDFADLALSKTAGKARDLIVNQQFLDRPVNFVLGTIATDDRGLLLVMGGHGKSDSPIQAPLNEPDSDFANHDGWYDDVSDGRISASVTLNDGSNPPVTDAWVIVGPPKYAPELQSPVSLYDTLLQQAIDRNMMASPFADPAFKPSLATDILPILTRAANFRWVYGNGATQFNPNGFHHTFNQMPPAGRAQVFARLSVPSDKPGNPGSGVGHMPKMWSDAYTNGANGSLTQTQYKMMQMWKDGNFVEGAPFDSTAPISPEGLTRAALEPCVGAAFFPGIEVSWKIRDVFPFVEPFRPDSRLLQPGDISSQMSLPWQTDFIDCSVEPSNVGQLVWWPAQRPINVLQTGSDAYHPWARTADSDTSQMRTPEDMLQAWSILGFILKQADGRFEEKQRG
jgi:hypothetical protein